MKLKILRKEKPLKFNFNMEPNAFQKFIKDKQCLVWWVKDCEKLSPEAVVEATLNYGNWNDVQELISILGIKKVAEIFRLKSKPCSIGRQNYNKKTKHYFNLYFDKHAG